MTSDSNIYKKDMQIIIITYYVIFMVYLNANFINIDDVIKRVNYKYTSCISLYKMLIKYLEKLFNILFLMHIDNIISERNKL